MGIRNEGKIKTRQLIIDETKNVLLEKGYMKLSTKNISERSNVSQGTIFLHFNSKNNLLNYILNQLIDDFHSDILETCKVDSNRIEFMHSVLGVISTHENVLSILYRDYSHLSDELRKSLDNAESSLKSLFFDNIRDSKGKKISIVDSFVLIDGILSQIKVILISKELNSTSNMIKQSSGKLNKLHKYLLQ